MAEAFTRNEKKRRFGPSAAHNKHRKEQNGYLLVPLEFPFSAVVEQALGASSPSPFVRKRSRGHRATRAAGAPVVGGGRDTEQHAEGAPWSEAARIHGSTCSGSPCGRQRPGYRPRALHGLRPSCGSKGVQLVGLLESPPVVDSSAYARSNLMSSTCTPISMVVVG